MRRLTPWLTAAAISAFATAPAAAQQRAPTTPAEPQQQQTQPATSTQSADDHISKAKEALDGIPKDGLAAPAAAKVAEVRRQLAALEKATAKTWATHVTAIDKSIVGLTADASIGADVKAKLEEVRTHVTAFAAAKSGTAAPPAQPPAADPMSTTAATGTTASTGTTGATPTQPTTGTMTETQPPPQQPAAPAAQPDQAVVRQHLSEARRVLSEMTQLPVAGQLQGEARTQVAQLITNFNALITAQTDWKDKYNAVEQNLNTLLGVTAGAAVAGTTGSTSATGTTATTGTAGTAGTTSTATGGAIELDPAIKTKLEEFRRHLTAFHAAAGGPSIPQL